MREFIKGISYFSFFKQDLVMLLQGSYIYKINANLVHIFSNVFIISDANYFLKTGRKSCVFFKCSVFGLLAFGFFSNEALIPDK